MSVQENAGPVTAGSRIRGALEKKPGEAPALVALVRESTGASQKLLVLANLGSEPVPVDVESVVLPACRLVNRTSHR